MASAITTTIAARVPNAVARDAQIVARDRGLTVSELVRVALRRELRAA